MTRKVVAGCKSCDGVRSGRGGGFVGNVVERWWSTGLGERIRRVWRSEERLLWRQQVRGSLVERRRTSLKIDRNRRTVCFGQRKFRNVFSSHRKTPKVLIAGAYRLFQKLPRQRYIAIIIVVVIVWLLRKSSLAPNNFIRNTTNFQLRTTWNDWAV